LAEQLTETMAEYKQNKFKQNVLPHIDISTNVLLPLMPLVQKREFPNKSFLLRAGEMWNKLYFVQSGLIRLFYLDTKGREFNKAFFWQDHCIWPVAPQDRTTAVSFYIAAVEETTVLECPFQYLHDILQQTGNWETFALPFAETLIEQKMQREQDFLLLSATERFAKFSAAYPEIVCRIPDYHLASFLGITNVSLSRIKRDLA